MLEITTELLEHYLRATGTQYDRAKLAALIAKDGIEEAAFMYLDIVGVFRLGLCAAAELDFAAEKAIGLGSSSAADQAGTAGLSGIAHLRDAGIEYLCWESARKC